MLRWNRLLSLSLIIIALSLHARYAVAQGGRVTREEEKHEPVEVTVTGGLEAEGVFRDTDLGRVGGAPESAEGETRLRLDIELTEKVSCLIGLRSVGRSDGVQIDVSALPTGKGADFRKWEVEKTRLDVDGEKLRPTSEENFYVTKESFFRKPAALVFAAIGSQYERYADTVKPGGETCHVTGEETKPSTERAGVARAIDRAGMAAGMGLLTSQARGDITGKKSTFHLDKDKMSRLGGGNDFVEISIENKDKHQTERLKVPLNKLLVAASETKTEKPKGLTAEEGRKASEAFLEGGEGTTTTTPEATPSQTTEKKEETPQVPEEEGLPLPPQVEERKKKEEAEKGLPLPPQVTEKKCEEHPATTERKPKEPKGPGDRTTIQLAIKDIIITPPPSSIVSGILITRDDDKWIPKLYGMTSATARIYRQVGPDDWEYPGPPQIISFKFLSRSNEKGDCMNHADSKAPDLYIPPEANGNELTEYSDDPTGKGDYGAARTTRRVTEQSISIGCTDYGAFGKIVALGEDAILLKRLPTGKVVRAESADEAAAKIPKDDNDNQIADQYEDDVFCKRFKATDDLDELPRGNGEKGDGLSAYEEYRGFYVKDKHTRTSWFYKTLFIHDRDNLTFGVFTAKSLLETYSIDGHEMDDDKVINFNKGHANVVTQHGLRMVNEPLGECILGRSERTSSARWNDLMGPPKNIVRIIIDKNKFLLRDGTVMIYTMQNVIAHELGHACSLRHHADPSSDGEYQTIYPPDKFTGKGVLQKVFIWFHDATHTKDYTKMDPVYLCAKRLPDKFWVGVKHNRYSGDVFCFMRYSGDSESIYPAGPGGGICSHPKPTGPGTILKGYDCVPNFVPPEDSFCSSPNGTSFNTYGHCAADAVKGDCEHQFYINDK